MARIGIGVQGKVLNHEKLDAATAAREKPDVNAAVDAVAMSAPAMEPWRILHGVRPERLSMGKGSHKENPVTKAEMARSDIN